jgi:shikimate dehydrogenase
VPHKEAVIPFLDELTPAAAAARAVNTIAVRAGGSLLGHSTDGPGFLADLREHEVAATRALVIGAGGAARAVVHALAERGVEVAVAARSVERAELLCDELRRTGPGLASLSAYAFPGALAALAPKADLIVNATSLGLHEGDELPWDPAAPLSSGQVVYDLIYNRETPFLRLARERGARAIDGLGMLVHQGAAAFELWTGQAAPVGVMRRAATG